MTKYDTHYILDNPEKAEEHIAELERKLNETIKLAIPIVDIIDSDHYLTRPEKVSVRTFKLCLGIHVAAQ